MGISVGTGIVSVGMSVGAGVEVGTAVAAAVIIAVVSIGVVCSGMRFEQEEDSIIMEAIRIASTLVKRFVFIIYVLSEMSSTGSSVKICVRHTTV